MLVSFLYLDLIPGYTEAENNIHLLLWTSKNPYYNSYAAFCWSESKQAHTQANLLSSRHQFDCLITTFVRETFKPAINHIQIKSKCCLAKKITQNCGRFWNKSILSEYKTVIYIYFYTVTVSSFNPHQHLTHKHTLIFRIIFTFTTTLLQMSGKKAITQSQELWAPKEERHTLHSRLL